MARSNIEKLRILNKGYEDDVAELQRTGQLPLLKETLKRLRGNSGSEKLSMFRGAEPFRMVFGVGSNIDNSDLANLSYHLDSIKVNGLKSAAKAYLAWLCVNYREPFGEAERFYIESGLNKIVSPFRKFVGNPRDALSSVSRKIKGDKLGYVDHGFANRVYNERDWEIANFRVAQERINRTGRLDLSKLRIDALPSSVGELHWITDLDCAVTLLTSLPDMSSLVSLQRLDVSYSPIDALPDLSKCPSLKSVFAGVSNIENLSGLAGCEKLTSLFCGSTSVATLEPLASCPSMAYLHCEDTWISELVGLESCKELKVLDCQDTAVEDLTPLSDCSDLKTLYLNGCELKADARAIWNKPSLKEVFFYRGSAVDVPTEKLSRSSHEDCLPRIREAMRLQIRPQF